MELLVTSLFLVAALKCFTTPGCTEAGILLLLCFFALVAVKALYHIFKPPHE